MDPLACRASRARWLGAGGRMSQRPGRPVACHGRRAGRTRALQRLVRWPGPARARGRATSAGRAAPRPGMTTGSTTHGARLPPRPRGHRGRKADERPRGRARVRGDPRTRLRGSLTGGEGWLPCRFKGSAFAGARHLSHDCPASTWTRDGALFDRPGNDGIPLQQLRTPGRCEAVPRGARVLPCRKSHLEALTGYFRRFPAMWSSEPARAPVSRPGRCGLRPPVPRRHAQAPRGS